MAGDVPALLPPLPAVTALDSILLSGRLHVDTQADLSQMKLALSNLLEGQEPPSSAESTAGGAVYTDASYSQSIELAIRLAFDDTAVWNPARDFAADTSAGLAKAFGVEPSNVTNATVVSRDEGSATVSAVVFGSSYLWAKLSEADFEPELANTVTEISLRSTCAATLGSNWTYCNAGAECLAADKHACAAADISTSSTATDEATCLAAGACTYTAVIDGEIQAMDAAGADSVTLAAADYSIIPGQVLRLVDADGQTCGATPKDTDLVVESISGAVITFATDITADDPTCDSNKCWKCELARTETCKATALDVCAAVAAGASEPVCSGAGACAQVIHDACVPRGSCADESTIDDNARIALDGLTATVVSSSARSMLEYGLIRKVTPLVESSAAIAASYRAGLSDTATVTAAFDTIGITVPRLFIHDATRPFALKTCVGSRNCSYTVLGSCAAADEGACAAADISTADAAADQSACEAAGACTYTAANSGAGVAEACVATALSTCAAVDEDAAKETCLAAGACAYTTLAPCIATHIATCAAANISTSNVTVDQQACEAAGPCTYAASVYDPEAQTMTEEACLATDEATCAAVFPDAAESECLAAGACDYITVNPSVDGDVPRNGDDPCFATDKFVCAAADLSSSDTAVDTAACEAAAECAYVPVDTVWSTEAGALSNPERCKASYETVCSPDASYFECSTGGADGGAAGSCTYKKIVAQGITQYYAESTHSVTIDTLELPLSMVMRVHTIDPATPSEMAAMEAAFHEQMVSVLDGFTESRLQAQVQGVTFVPAVMQKFTTGVGAAASFEDGLPMAHVAVSVLAHAASLASQAGSDFVETPLITTTAKVEAAVRFVLVTRTSAEASSFITSGSKLVALQMALASALGSCDDDTLLTKVDCEDSSSTWTGVDMYDIEVTNRWQGVEFDSQGTEQDVVTVEFTWQMCTGVDSACATTAHSWSESSLDVEALAGTTEDAGPLYLADIITEDKIASELIFVDHEAVNVTTTMEFTVELSHTCLPPAVCYPSTGVDAVLAFLAGNESLVAVLNADAGLAASFGETVQVRENSAAVVVVADPEPPAPPAQNPCAEGSNLTLSNGTIEFSSDMCAYNCECEWQIRCPPREVNEMGTIRGYDDLSVTLSFDSFSTEAYYDTVTLFDGMGNESVALTPPISGPEAPLGAISSTSQSMLVRFRADSSDATVNSFRARYTCGLGQGPVEMNVTFLARDSVQSDEPSAADLYRDFLNMSTDLNSTMYSQPLLSLLMHIGPSECNSSIWAPTQRSATEWSCSGIPPEHDCDNRYDAHLLSQGDDGDGCNSLLAAGISCGLYFCKDCMYAHYCDGACGYCEDLPFVSRRAVVPLYGLYGPKDGLYSTASTAFTPWVPARRMLTEGGGDGADGAACTEVTAPSKGSAGDCAATLASGGTCQPLCGSGYLVSGPTSCSDGVLSAATCDLWDAAVRILVVLDMELTDFGTSDIQSGVSALTSVPTERIVVLDAVDDSSNVSQHHPQPSCHISDALCCLCLSPLPGVDVAGVHNLLLCLLRASRCHTCCCPQVTVTVNVAPATVVSETTAMAAVEQLVADLATASPTLTIGSTPAKYQMATTVHPTCVDTAIDVDGAQPFEEADCAEGLLLKHASLLSETVCDASACSSTVCCAAPWYAGFAVSGSDQTGLLGTAIQEIGVDLQNVVKSDVAVNFGAGLVDMVIVDEFPRSTGTVETDHIIAANASLAVSGTVDRTVFLREVLPKVITDSGSYMTTRTHRYTRDPFQMVRNFDRSTYTAHVTSYSQNTRFEIAVATHVCASCVATDAAACEAADISTDDPAADQATCEAEAACTYTAEDSGNGVAESCAATDFAACDAVASDAGESACTAAATHDSGDSACTYAAEACDADDFAASQLIANISVTQALNATESLLNLSSATENLISLNVTGISGTRIRTDCYDYPDGWYDVYGDGCAAYVDVVPRLCTPDGSDELDQICVGQAPSPPAPCGPGHGSGWDGSWGQIQAYANHGPSQPYGIPGLSDEFAGQHALNSCCGCNGGRHENISAAVFSFMAATDFDIRPILASTNFPAVFGDSLSVSDGGNLTTDQADDVALLMSSFDVSPPKLGSAVAL